MTLHVEAQSITLKPHRAAPGSLVAISVKSESNGGKMTVMTGEHVTEGTMDIRRERLLIRRLTAKGLTYHVKKDRATTTMTMDGAPQKETTDAALTLATVHGMKDNWGHWRLFIQGRSANSAEAVELAELEAYENRRWFLNGPVKVGQSWPIDPGFMRHIMKRDTGEAKVEATATLEEVAVIDGEKTAVLAIAIKTRGTKASPGADTSAGAIMNLNGVLHITLDTMLDRKLVLSGHTITISKISGQTTKVKLPTRMEVLKTVK